MDKPNTDGDGKAYIGFTHDCSLFTVYENGTAKNWHFKFNRRADGKWLRADGSYLKPSLQTALQEAYATLVGEAQP